MDDERILDARLALWGVALGDAFGQVFLYQSGAPSVLLRRRTIPKGVWRWSDDTVMATAIVEVLTRAGRIDQDALAKRFAEQHVAEPERGYGAVAQHILNQISSGVAWQQAAGAVYKGSGSMGNGGAMRVAPVGAYFSGEIDVVVREARASAEVTHAHPEGQAGAIAIAVAAAFVKQKYVSQTPWTAAQLFSIVLVHTPKGAVHDGVRQAQKLGDIDVTLAARKLGNGADVTAPDTVPYVIWAFAHHHESFEDALFFAMGGLLDAAADRDTVCAMVGGLAALHVGLRGLPAAWLERLEPLPSFDLSPRM